MMTLALAPTFWSSRKGFSRDSKEIANASDIAEPPTLSELSPSTTKQKILAMLLTENETLI